MSNLLQLSGLRLRFPMGKNRWLTAIDDVSFSISPGETLALVGESGSGKSSTARAVLCLEAAIEGDIIFRGKHLLKLGSAALRAERRHVQMVFQDPFNSLDPRMRVEDLIAEPLDIAGGYKRTARREKVRELLELVGLPDSFRLRYPRALSGGQRQRIGIARALALSPDLVICDEAVSALDVSVQAQILNLLRQLQQQLGIAYLFISHDLAVVRLMADRIAVMYLGRLVELASAAHLFAEARHPYTQALLAAAPIADPTIQPQRWKAVVGGDLPSAFDPPKRMCFPYALSPCEGPLRGQTPGIRRGRARRIRRVPLLARNTLERTLTKNSILNLTATAR